MKQKTEKQRILGKTLLGILAAALIAIPTVCFSGCQKKEENTAEPVETTTEAPAQTTAPTASKPTPTPSEPTTEPPVEEPAPSENKNKIVYTQMADGTYCVSYEGKGEANVVIPDTFEGKTVTKILKGSFVNCTEIKSIVLPATITEIEAGAFVGCSNLESISFSGENPVYSVKNNCIVKQGTIVVGNAKGEITADPSVTTIGAYAFSGAAVSENLVIPANIVVIKVGAFENCKTLKSVEIPTTVESLDNNAFKGCTSLKTVSVSLELFHSVSNSVSPETVTILESGETEIGEGFFRNMSSLKTVNLPSNITKIGAYAFEGCSSLTSFTFPAGMQADPGIGAFSGCSNLRELKIEEPVNENQRTATYRVLDNCLIRGNTIVLGCAGSAIPTAPAVTKIASYAFYNCASLLNGTISIGENIATIEDSAFWYCSGLNTLNISQMKTGYGARAFNGCSNISSIEVPLAALKLIQNKAGVRTATIVGTCTSVAESAFENYYSLQSVTFKGEVKTIGKYAFAGCSALKNVNIQLGNAYDETQELTFAYTGYGEKTATTITSIGAYAFEGCKSLNNLIIPNTVTTIGEKAFMGCTAISTVSTPAKFLDGTIPVAVLTSAKITAGTTLPVKAFENAVYLSDVVIDCNMVTIGESAFSGCANLRSVECPASLTTLGENAFFRCSSLQTVVIPTSVIGHLSSAKASLVDVTIIKGEVIAANAFADFTALSRVMIKADSGVTKILGGAFQNCVSLSDMTIPVATTEIGANAFANCGKLSEVKNLKDSYVTTIGAGAFKNCGAITTLELPVSVQKIYDSAFAGCYGIVEIVLPADLIELSNTAFDSCTSLRTVTLPLFALKTLGSTAVKSLESITINNAARGEDFGSWLKGSQNLKYVALYAGMETINASAFQNCINLTTVIVPEGVKDIKDYAFNGCTSLTSIDLPSTIVTIAPYSFAGCSKLATVNLNVNAGLTEIGMYAFSDCSALTEIKLPKRVEYVRQYAFKGCDSLNTIYFPAVLKEIEYNAFLNCNSVAQIYYGGTKTAWTYVKIDMTGNGNAAIEGTHNPDMKYNQEY